MLTFTGIFTPNDNLANEVVAASEVAGEKLWRLPMEESYWDSMKSGVADMVNTGGRQGGSITAALFLKQVSCSSIFWFFSSLLPFYVKKIFFLKQFHYAWRLLIRDGEMSDLDGLDDKLKWTVVG